MITINPVNFYNKKYVSFGEGNLNNISSSVGILSLQAPDAKREFAGNQNITKNADAVQTNPAKAFVYKLVKAYNMAVKSGQSTPNNNPKQISFVG